MTPLWGLDELTDQEILNYWATLSPEERIQEIRDLDLIQRATPIVEYGGAVAVLTKDGDLLINSQELVIQIYQLRYKIQIQEQLIKDFYKETAPVWPYLLLGAAGIGAGILIGVFL